MIDSTVRLPRSVLILGPLLLLLITGGSRLIYRVFKEYQFYRSYLRKGEPVIILGTGAAAISLVKDLSQSTQWRAVGLLDNDKTMHGREILGVKVLGSTSDLSKAASRYGVHHVIIAMPLASQQERKKVMDLVNQLGLEALTIPVLDDLISGRLSVSQIRRIDVQDLLGREAVNLDNSGLQHLISEHTVLISGAGGSIGSELCRQVIKFNPSHLICVDISEYFLYQLEHVS
jgi:FlaA1/EpsC-like NDP-sugar epimerase